MIIIHLTLIRVHKERKERLRTDHSTTGRGGTFTFFLLLKGKERKVESQLTFLSFLKESESATPNFNYAYFYCLYITIEILYYSVSNYNIRRRFACIS